MAFHSDPANAAACVFCARSALDAVLLETEHFFLLADHAPLIEGHLLIVPRGHYACYGAVPEALEHEFLHLKGQVAEFFQATYRAPVFFEHGIFHQTVFHAHLHAFPFGPVDIGVHALARPAGQTVRSLADVRSWFGERGHYFYIEQPPASERPAQAAIFPPDESIYFRVLGALRTQAGGVNGWQPQQLRRLSGDKKVQALVEAWRTHASGA